MNRFKILKGHEPPPLTEEQKNHVHITQLWKKIIEGIDTKTELQKLSRTSSMDRFKILKGFEPPNKPVSGFISVDGKVIGKINSWHIAFPKEAMVNLNGKNGWLNKNGNFYPEEVVRKALEQGK
jgi:hypothetical protein